MDTWIKQRYADSVLETFPIYFHSMKETQDMNRRMSDERDSIHIFPQGKCN
jgi:hypothetical protein